WEPGGRPRRAGVSSFGISGTNAHLILEEAPPAPAREPSERAPVVAAGTAAALPFVVSGRGGGALAVQARELERFTAAREELDLSDLAVALALDRAQLTDRAVVLASDRRELLDGLRAVGGGEPVPNVVEGVAGRGGRTAFLFPGQGSQWAGMGRELLADSPVFEQRMGECERALAEYVDWSLTAVLRGDEDAWLGRVDVVQPALFAVMVSLAELWQALGVKPDLLIGHSQGEIAAACVAGALSLDDAARVIALRSQAIARLAGQGSMVSVSLGRDELEELLRTPGLDVSLAAVNGARSTVVSGAIEALDAFVAHCAANGVDTRRIPVDYASHSAQIEALRDDLLSALAPIRPASGRIPLYSTLTGTRIDTVQMDAEYWYRSLRNPVLFEDATRLAVEAGTTTFVEVSPHPVLRMAVEQTIDSAQPPQAVRVVSSLRREAGGGAELMRAAAAAFTHGAPIDWATVLPDRRARVGLPGYAFQSSRFWLEGSSAAELDPEQLGQRSAEHPFLRAAIELPEADGWIFTGRVSLAEFPWLGEHVVGRTCLLPGAALVEMAAVAGARAGLPVVHELALTAPLALDDGDAVALRVVLGAPEEGRCEVEVLSRRDGEDGAGWIRHATGLLADGAGAGDAAALAAGAWPPAGAEPLDTSTLYDDLATAGLVYGPVFAGVRRAWRRGDEWFAEVEPEDAGDDGFAVHPARFDAVLQGGLLPDWTGDGARVVALPFAFSGVRLGAGGAGAMRVAVSADGDAARLHAVDERGVPVVEVDALRERPADVAQLGATPVAGSLLDLAWHPLSETATAGARAVAEVRDADGIRALEGAPRVLRWQVRTGSGEGPAEGEGPRESRARACAREALEVVQAFLGEPRFAECRLVVMTRAAVQARPYEDVDHAAGAVWGLVRSAAAEHPGRFVLVDADVDGLADRDLAAVLDGDDWQVAVRDGALLVPRLEPSSDELLAGRGAAWRVEAGEGGTFDELRVLDEPERLERPGPGRVLVGVRSAGVNFRDTLVALGMYPGHATIGGEGAGVVLDVGPDVTRVAPGDRVMGMLPGAFGPRVVADERLVMRVPEGWSFEQAASVPIAFLTAYHCLIDLAGLRAGERVLVHAGAGGVGMAAIQLARHLGAEVFATASPGKWDAL
ncbi:MAG TPA: acyltransferase domain-containing protein, partial [Thermoleophilaceae bacterium]